MPSLQSVLKQAAVTLAVIALVSFAAKRIAAVNSIVNGPPLA